MIDLSKISKGFKGRAIALDKRLTDWESGFYSHYGNNACGLKIIAEGLISNISLQCILLPDLRKTISYFDLLYSELDFSTVPLNPDTACFFVCRDLYPYLRRNYEEFLENIDLAVDILPSLIELKYWGKLFMDIGRPSYTRINTEVLFPLKEIPGCEERSMRKRVPKGYEL